MDIKTGFAFLIAGGLVVNLFVGIYLLYTQIEKAEALLHDVKFVQEFKSFFGDNWLGRQARLTAIARVVMMPNVMQRRGEISSEACLRLPVSFKLLVWTLYTLSFACCFGMACYYFLVD